MLFWTAFIDVVKIPQWTMSHVPSESWRALTDEELRGREIYIKNGCIYCHSQYVRPQDWGLGAQRIAQAGDYAGQLPPLLGSQRTGPDLSQEGGEHPDDWHVAHFENPRYTSPMSVMPEFSFHSDAEISDLIGYVQSLGAKDADFRVQRQETWGEQARAAYAAGPDESIEWLHANVPEVWRVMPNPYPPSEPALARGERIYQMYCVGCHGASGDGRGPAAEFLDPQPQNFASLRRNLVDDKYIGGILYYQIMNGVTGSAMPYFKTHLESAKIWDVSNYIAYNFIGKVDYQCSEDEIPVAYEGPEMPSPDDEEEAE